MKTLSIILPRQSTPWHKIAHMLVMERRLPDAEKLLYDLAEQAGIQIAHITTSLTITGKVQLKAQLAGDVDSIAIVVAGDAVYQQGTIDSLFYQDEERLCKIWLHGHWTRTWL